MRQLADIKEHCKVQTTQPLRKSLPQPWRPNRLEANLIFLAASMTRLLHIQWEVMLFSTIPIAKDFATKSMQCLPLHHESAVLAIMT